MSTSIAPPTTPSIRRRLVVQNGTNLTRDRGEDARRVVAITEAGDGAAETSEDVAATGGKIFSRHLFFSIQFSQERKRDFSCLSATTDCLRLILSVPVFVSAGGCVYATVYSRQISTHFSLSHSL